tara:strand:+ start:148 stop:438 length:291 start_codon:yes stop_codon:yes gene_type:complete
MLWTTYHTTEDQAKNYRERRRFNALDQYLWDKHKHHVRERDKCQQYSSEYNIHAAIAYEIARDQEKLNNILKHIGDCYDNATWKDYNQKEDDNESM